MCSDRETRESLREIYIIGFWIILTMLITFPVIWILSMAETDKIYSYVIVVLSILGPFFEIERRRKDFNLKKERIELNKKIAFAKMQRDGWPWNQDVPLSQEEQERLLKPLLM